MHKQKNLMRNVYSENFKKPRNSHKHWSCEASISFLVSKTGLYQKDIRLYISFRMFVLFFDNKKGHLPYFTENVLKFYCIILFRRNNIVVYRLSTELYFYITVRIFFLNLITKSLRFFFCYFFTIVNAD